MSLPSEWVDRIFERLTVLFGRRFSDLYAGVDPNALRKAWAEELGGFANQPERIAKALHAFKGAQHPPSLSEFVAMCRQQHGDGHGAQLDSPRTDPAAARANLARIREMLRTAVKVMP